MSRAPTDTMGVASFSQKEQSKHKGRAADEVFQNICPPKNSVKLLDTTLSVEGYRSVEIFPKIRTS